MPGFTTHYLFGEEAYKRLPDSGLRRIIKTDRRAFSLGLQGPDVFFYYLPSYLMHTDNLGALAHDRDTGTFFSHLLQSRFLFEGNEKKANIADAYICGFMGHYTLDCTIHPYVYAFTGYDPQKRQKSTEYFGQHSYFETELDNEMLRLCKNIKPTEFHQNATIHLSAVEKRVVSVMLAYAYRHTYHVLATPLIMRGAMRWMETGTRLINDPSGQKKVMVRLVEKYALDRPFISPMLASDNYRFVPDPFNESHRTWVHPWTQNRSKETFMDLFQKAGDLYDSHLNLYGKMVEKGFTEERKEALLKSYGNRSFLSGEALG